MKPIAPEPSYLLDPGLTLWPLAPGPGVPTSRSLLTFIKVASSKSAHSALPMIHRKEDDATSIEFLPMGHPGSNLLPIAQTKWRGREEGEKKGVRKEREERRD